MKMHGKATMHQQSRGTSPEQVHQLLEEETIFYPVLLLGRLVHPRNAEAPRGRRKGGGAQWPNRSTPLWRYRVSLYLSHLCSSRYRRVSRHFRSILTLSCSIFLHRSFRPPISACCSLVASFSNIPNFRWTSTSCWCSDAIPCC